MAASIEESRIVSPQTVAAKTSLSRTTIWRLTRAKKFPSPLRLSTNRIGWREADVLEWMASRSTPAEAAA